MEKHEIVIKGKGIRIYVLSAVFVVLGVITMITSFISFRRIYKNYDEMQSAYQFIEVEREAAADFKTASDYLTDQARRFVVTGNIENALNYFEEKDVTKRRENALKLIGSTEILNFESGLLNNAMEQSEALVEYEIHAMRLVADVKNISKDLLPAAVSSYVLPSDEISLSNEKKQSLAINLLYDNNYEEYKKKINWDVESAIVLIKEESGTRFREDEADLIIDINIAASLVIVIFLLLLMIFIFNTFLVVRPLKMFVKALNDRKKLPVIGGYELRKFARRYDEIYGSNIKNNELIKEHDEIDELTGTLKVGTLEYIRRNLTLSHEPLGIMFVDIDNFRSIKETNGYEMADKVVAKVAKLLIKYFQGGDYIVRVTQDGFEIFLNKINPYKSDILIERIEKINKKLSDTSDDVVSASVSAGVAFYEKGFTNELERKADMALNYVKENGRGTCKIS